MGNPLREPRVSDTGIYTGFKGRGGKVVQAKGELILNITHIHKTIHQQSAGKLMQNSIEGSELSSIDFDKILRDT